MLWATAPLMVQARVAVLDQARAELTVDGATTTAPVGLPYGWDFHHRGQSGLGRFALEFDGPSSGSDPWAMYFFRLGNGYTVRLNGTLLEQNGATRLPTPDTGDYAKVPRLIRIPPSVLQPHNQLEVVIRSDSGRRSGMPAVWVGPALEVEPLYRQEYALRVGGSAVFTVFSLMVGAFAAVLWLTQTDPRPEHRGVRDNLYLYAAMAEFSWAVFIGDTLIERAPLPWAWWSVVVNLVLGVWLSSVLLLCHSIAGWEQHPASRWTRRLLLALILASPAVTYYTISGPSPLLLTAWQLVFVLVFVPSTALFVVQAVRQAGAMHRIVALVLMVNVPIGLHDFYIMRLADSFSIHALLRY